MNEVFIPLPSQKALLDLARRTLEEFVRAVRRSRAEIDDAALHVRDPGVFVSLHKKGELRGCIGTLAGLNPLYETVIEMTEAAASRDSRVKPVQPSELDQIRISISILSPLEPTDQPLLLEVGKHGLHVTRGMRRGVLLPQVATEQEWNMQTFLEQTCLKAGLRKNAWRRHDTKISCFTTLIIEEPPWNGVVLSHS
jgi:AmmeMemoRadiSam system protein A